MGFAEDRSKVTKIAARASSFWEEYLGRLRGPFGQALGIRQGQKNEWAQPLQSAASTPAVISSLPQVCVQLHLDLEPRLPVSDS